VIKADADEARAAIEDGLSRLTDLDVDDWESWWMRNREHLEPGGKER